MFVQRSFNSNTVVFNLVLINVLVFLSTMVFGDAALVENFALSLPGSGYFKPWQLVTHGFLHVGFFHLFMNMFALFMFGTVLEQVWGPRRFLIYYGVTLVGAALTYLAVTTYQQQGELMPVNHYALGASGAVFGVLLAYGMLFPNTEIILFPIPIPIKAKYLVIGYGAFELYMGLKNDPGDSIAHFAHLGGMIFGFILIKYWKHNSDTFY